MSSLFRRFVDAVNTVPVMALNVPGLRSLAGRYFTVVTYTGRLFGPDLQYPGQLLALGRRHRHLGRHPRIQDVVAKLPR